MTDRACVLGCVTRGEHFAACPAFGKPEDMTCTGCVPEPARDMALICDRCFRRLRGLVNNAPDLLGRIRSLSDPAKARVYDTVPVGGRAPEAPAPVAADLLDAADGVMRILSGWGGYLIGSNLPAYAVPASWGPETVYLVARDHADRILHRFDQLVNDKGHVEMLSDAVLTLHAPDEHGERQEWSVADAMYRWQAERRTRDEVWLPDAVELLEATPVSEWGEGQRLVSRAEAAKIARVTEDRFRGWVRRGIVRPAVDRGDFGVQAPWFREADAIRLRDDPPRRGRPRKNGGE